MSLKAFIFSKIFFKNLAAAVALALIVSIGLFFSLAIYTEHGETVSVPDFTGISVKDIEAFADTTEIEYEVVDSLYSDEIPKGTVADQEPKPGYKVKRGRKIYLTVNAMLARQVAMPDVRNLSLRQAKAVLESVGLVLGGLEYQPDIAKNAVLDQRVRGRSVSKGKTVFVGTVVDLVLGDGLSNTRVPIPYLLYYTLSEATERLKASSLNVGTYKVDGEVRDTSLMRVFKQIPVFKEGELLPMGSSVILFLTMDTASIDYDPSLYTTGLPPDSLQSVNEINENQFE